MDGFLNSFAGEIVIIAMEAVIFLPFIIFDYRIIKKITAMGIPDKDIRKFNRIKFPIAAAAMFICGLIIWCILEFGFNIFVVKTDLWLLVVVVSALCAFGMALPVCDYIRYKMLINT